MTNRYRVRPAPFSMWTLERFQMIVCGGQEIWSAVDTSKDKSFIDDRLAYAEGRITEAEFCARNRARRRAQKAARNGKPQSLASA